MTKREYHKLFQNGSITTCKIQKKLEKTTLTKCPVLKHPIFKTGVSVVLGMISCVLCHRPGTTLVIK